MELPKMQMQDKKILTAIGMMSGTSMDGIDVAMIRSDGEKIVERGPFLDFPFTNDIIMRLKQGIIDAKNIENREDRPASLAMLESEVTMLHAEALSKFIKTYETKNIDLVGFHGQTVLHRPDKALTVQLGNGEALANICSFPVVYDLRANDMLHKGQGAPLIPIYNKALLDKLPEKYAASAPFAFVNIGGISNVTYIDEQGELIAFDTGPGNALIDQWVFSKGKVSYDLDGIIASEGKIIPQIVERYLDESFFQQKPPKSLDRNDFKPLDDDAISLADGARTLANVSAQAIFKAIDHLPKPPKLWIISGGGRKHPAIIADMTLLASEIGSTLIIAEDAGLDGDAMEAEAWAHLAVRSIKGLPLTFPMTTGCSQPVTGGKLAMPATS